ncbi:MAG: radical SAM protein [Marinilabiliaceae bacterium]|nr:radical SAM protein [Marinilabiliaceae bacterium]
MEAFHHYLNDLISRNKEIYSAYPEMKWLTPYDAYQAEEKRTNLLQWNTNNWLFKKTKPFYNTISKGCKLCGEGKWSCLFITGKCNAKCFYCPTPQQNDDLPTSQQLTFDTPAAYAEYISHFNFEGVSISGGEPLLFFDKTLSYINEVRKKCSPDLYIWMYTNGILATKEKINLLKKAGLNEIRFDIGATNYNLKKLNLAQGIIDNITIEIPAIPEEKDRLKSLLPEMIKTGVKHLNLHQLRLTPYNAPKLTKHNYTYIAAEHPIVLESELAALEIMQYAHQNKLQIGINYCSFFFKYRFQKSGFRRQITQKLIPNNNVITEKGYIRHSQPNSVSYKGIILTDVSNNKSTIKLNLNHKSFDIQEGVALADTNITNEKQKDFFCNEPTNIPTDINEFNIWNHEYIENGLRLY